MKRHLGWLGSCVLAIGTPSIALADDYPDIINRYRASIVKIIPAAVLPDGKIDPYISESGSGVIIGSEGFILTAYHVPKGGNITCDDEYSNKPQEGIHQIFIPDDSGVAIHRFNARCVLSNDKLDLALLKIFQLPDGQEVKPTNLTAAPLWREHLLIGGKYFAFGYGGRDVVFSSTETIVSGRNQDNTHNTNDPLARGVSGGAVLNSLGCLMAVPLEAGESSGLVRSLATASEFFKTMDTEEEYSNIRVTQSRLALEYSCEVSAIAGKFALRLGGLYAPSRNSAISLSSIYLLGGDPIPSFRWRFTLGASLGRNDIVHALGQVAWIYFTGQPRDPGPYVGLAADGMLGVAAHDTSAGIGVQALVGTEIPLDEPTRSLVRPDIRVPFEFGVGYLLQANPSLYFNVQVGVSLYF